MNRTLAILLVISLIACSKQELEDPSSPVQEGAISLAAMKCQSNDKMNWLRDIVRLAETDDVRHNGTIYAIPYSNGTAILYQPWVSSCFGCLVYDCNGDLLVTTETEKSEIISGATEANIIYTSLN